MTKYTLAELREAEEAMQIAYIDYKDNETIEFWAKFERARDWYRKVKDGG